MILTILEQSVDVDLLNLLVCIRLTMELSELDKSPRELTRDVIPVYAEELVSNVLKILLAEVICSSVLVTRALSAAVNEDKEKVVVVVAVVAEVVVVSMVVVVVGTDVVTLLVKTTPCVVVNIAVVVVVV